MIISIAKIKPFLKIGTNPRTSKKHGLIGQLFIKKMQSLNANPSGQTLFFAQATPIALKHF